MNQSSRLAFLSMDIFSAISQFPALPGSYGLFFEMGYSHVMEIGRLGTYRLPDGMYAYFGSAHGSGGLKARLKHHLLPKQNPHWHIDYLFEHIDFRFCLYSHGRMALECAWSEAFDALSQTSIPIPRFGSSDCKYGCRSHLIHFERDLSIETLCHIMQNSGNEEVFVIILDP